MRFPGDGFLVIGIVVLHVGCGGGRRAEYPGASAAVAAEIRRDAAGWLACDEGSIAIEPLRERAWCERHEPGSNGCAEWSEHRVEIAPGVGWSVSGCGRTEQYFCVGCGGPGLCQPSAIIDRMDCATFQRG